MKIIGQLKAILGLDKSQYDRGLDQAERQASGFGNTIKRIGGWITAAFSVGAIINFSKEAMKLSATAEGIRAGFARIATPGLLEDLRKATRGAVSDVQLMQKAIQASNFQIPLNQLAKLLEFASARAIQTGQSIDYLVDSIVLGIGRKSPLILDNLGISAVRLREELKGVGTESASVGDIAASVARIASEELGKMGNVADTTATKMERLKVASEKFKEAWGNWVNKSNTINAFREYFTTILNFWADESKNFGEKAMMLMPFFGGNFLKPKGYTNLNPLAEGTESSGGPLNKTTAAAEKQGQTIKDLKDKIESYKAAIDDTLVSDQARRNEILNQIKATEDLIAKLTTLQEKITRVEALNKILIDASKISVGGKVQAPGIQSFKGTVATDAEIQRQTIQGLTEDLQNQQVAVDILSSAFDSLFSSVDGGFKAMIESIIGSIKRLIAELLARAAVLAILNIITGGGAKLGTIIKAAAGSMGITKMASGGTVPPGYPNDTFPALLSSGEKVIPRGSAGRFGEKISVEVTGTILNRDISVSGRRAQREN